MSTTYTYCIPCGRLGTEQCPTCAKRSWYQRLLDYMEYVQLGRRNGAPWLESLVGTKESELSPRASMRRWWRKVLGR